MKPMITSGTSKIKNALQGRYCAVSIAVFDDNIAYPFRGWAFHVLDLLASRFAFLLHLPLMPVHPWTHAERRWRNAPVPNQAT